MDTGYNQVISSTIHAGTKPGDVNQQHITSQNPNVSIHSEVLVKV